VESAFLVILVGIYRSIEAIGYFIVPMNTLRKARRPKSLEICNSIAILVMQILQIILLGNTKKDRELSIVRMNVIPKVG